MSSHYIRRLVELDYSLSALLNRTVLVRIKPMMNIRLVVALNTMMTMVIIADAVTPVFLASMLAASQNIPKYRSFTVISKVIVVDVQSGSDMNFLEPLLLY